MAFLLPPRARARGPEPRYEPNMPADDAAAAGFYYGRPSRRSQTGRIASGRRSKFDAFDADAYYDAGTYHDAGVYYDGGAYTYAPRRRAGPPPESPRASREPEATEPRGYQHGTGFIPAGFPQQPAARVDVEPQFEYVADPEFEYVTIEESLEPSETWVLVPSREKREAPFPQPEALPPLPAAAALQKKRPFVVRHTDCDRGCKHCARRWGDESPPRALEKRAPCGRNKFTHRRHAEAFSAAYDEAYGDWRCTDLWRSSYEDWRGSYDDWRGSYA
ncbi:hypothetical protein M885DRAFT_505350 [Pelagophyceae sp. CCMP2097]|nr:hypothetical protein M885DRAFT_505350 [Pelagophyceae sp. CCMP2097]